MLANVTSNGARDVDFLHGSWTFHLRKPRDTTDPDCTEWVESEGTSEAFEGFTLRLYDPATDTSRIWWSSTRAPGVLDEPVRDGGGTWATNWITTQRRRTYFGRGGDRQPLS
jgi:hypothetical protein